MRILPCLRCQRESLVPTGAFWACGTCGYAITQSALFAEQASRQAMSRAQLTGGKPPEIITSRLVNCSEDGHD